MNRFCFIFAMLFWILFLGVLRAQQRNNNLFDTKLTDDLDIKLTAKLGLQFWSAYTMGSERYDTQESRFIPVADRLNSYIRRTRFGFDASAFDRLKLNLTLAMDNIGRDVLSGTESGANNGSSPSLRVLDLYVTGALLDSERLMLTMGYFRPQLGRESVNSALSVSSIEKSWSQNYLRKHLVGNGSGRAAGLNIGGQYSFYEQFHSRYDIGLFSAAFTDFQGNSTGDHSAPLIVARWSFIWGDKEQQSYSMSRKNNYFGRRTGFSLALAASHQGRTSLYKHSRAYGLDLLWNYGDWNVDAEQHILIRGSQSSEESRSTTGYVRITRNIPIRYLVLEPSLMWVFFYGENEKSKQENSILLQQASGMEQFFNVGVNLHITKDFKVGFHYTHRWADSGELDDSFGVNNFYSDPIVGGIRRGDWLGLTSIAIF